MYSGKFILGKRPQMQTRLSWKKVKVISNTSWKLPMTCVFTHKELLGGINWELLASQVQRFDCNEELLVDCGKSLPSGMHRPSDSHNIGTGATYLRAEIVQQFYARMTQGVDFHLVDDKYYLIANLVRIPDFHMYFGETEGCWVTINRESMLNYHACIQRNGLIYYQSNLQYNLLNKAHDIIGVVSSVSQSLSVHQILTHL